MTAWTVPATVVRVIDGDTVVVDLDLGWRVYRNREHLRIAGINAPELSTAAGKASRDHAASLVPPGLAVTVVSEAKPSFERTVGSIRIPIQEGYGIGSTIEPIEVDFAEEMVLAGHAERVEP